MNENKEGCFGINFFGSKEWGFEVCMFIDEFVIFFGVGVWWLAVLSFFYWFFIVAWICVWVCGKFWYYNISKNHWRM